MEPLMSGALRAPNRSWWIAVAVCALVACSKSDGGARVSVVNGPGAPTPQYLLFDWSDSQQLLVHDRRVPETASLDPQANPLAVIQISASGGADLRRTMRVRGIAGEQTVSVGEGTVQIVPGTWQPLTITLAPAAGDAEPLPDAGAPDAEITADAEVDVAPAGALPDLPPPPPDATPIDIGAPDTAPIAADVRADPGADRSPDGPAQVVAVAALADSYVEQGSTSSTQNHGTATTLEVKTQAGQDNNRIAFFRFSLPMQSVPVTAGTLRIWGRAGSGTSMDSVYGVPDDTWMENTITWNNKPALGNKLATLSIGTASQYRDWSVGGYVRSQIAAGHGTASFAISMDNGTSSSPDTFNSREATSNPPVLILVY